MHECDYCGSMCDCDMEDHDQRQPNDRPHLIDPRICDAERDDFDDEDEGEVRDGE